VNNEGVQKHHVSVTVWPQWLFNNIHWWRNTN